MIFYFEGFNSIPTALTAMTAPHLTLMHSFLYIRLSEPYGCLGLRYLSSLARWAEQGSNHCATSPYHRQMTVTML